MLGRPSQDSKSNVIDETFLVISGWLAASGSDASELPLRCSHS